MHQWRQCDAFSMAINYALEPRGLFRPAMHFQHGTGGGEAVGEFPLSYYANGKLWKVFGVQPWTLRWTHLALLLFGCWCLFQTVRQFVSIRSALAVTWLTMGSSLLAFYGPNYLVNAASLGLIYVGWWQAYKWWRSDCTDLRSRLFMVATFTMALLFRPTMALGLIPVAFAACDVRHWRRWAVAVGIPVFVGVLWVLWAKWVNTQNDSVYFLTSTKPLWDADSIATTWRAFREDILPQWYHRYVRILAVSALFVSIIRYVRMRDLSLRWLSASAAATAAASVGYIVLWFENLNVHDYYLIELQVGVPIIAVWAISCWASVSRTAKRWLWALFFAALVLQLMDAGLRTRMKHRPVRGWLNELIIPSRERGVWEWFHWDQERRFGNALEWNGVLRSIGIKRDDLIISVTDPSPNISLSLMDQKGFTNLYDDAYQGEKRIAFYVTKGASYLVCNNPDWYEANKDSRWLSKQMMQMGNFRVFNLFESDGYVKPQNTTDEQ